MDLEEQSKGIQHVTKAAMEIKTWRRDLCIEGVEGDHGTNGKSRMGTCTLSYVKQIASGNLLYGSRGSNRVSVTSLEVWDGVGKGREVQERETQIYTYG